MHRYSKATFLIVCLLVLTPDLALGQGENFRRITTQSPQPGPRDLANTTSTVMAINPQGRTRIVVGYNDFRGMPDQTDPLVSPDARLSRSVMGFAYSDDLGDTWRTGLIRPGNFIDAIIGSPSLAVMEPVLRGLSPTRIFYAAVATIRDSGGQTQIVISGSNDGGQTFSPAMGAPQINFRDSFTADSPSIYIDPTPTIDPATRMTTEHPLGRVLLTFVANPGTDRASIRFAIGTPRPGAGAGSIAWSVSKVVDDVDAADRPYLRHPVIQRLGGKNVIVFEIHRPIPRSLGSEDRELQLVAMEEYVDLRSLSTRWRRMTNQPNDGRTMRFTSQTTRSSSGYHPANNVAMMSFKSIPTEYGVRGRPESLMPASNTGLLVWAGKQTAGPGWQGVHFQQLKVREDRDRTLAWEPRVQVSEGTTTGMAFQPTISARWDLWAVSWFQQDAQTGRVRLMGATRYGNRDWGSARNLTAIQSRVNGSTVIDMPICATSSLDWGSYISSVVIASLLNPPFVLTIHVDSRLGDCSDFSRPNSARFQEVAATRWRF